MQVHEDIGTEDFPSESGLAPCLVRVRDLSTAKQISEVAIASATHRAPLFVTHEEKFAALHRCGGNGMKGSCFSFCGLHQLWWSLSWW